MKGPKLLYQILMPVRCPNAISRSIADIQAAKAKSVADSINQSGGRALAVPGDMLDAEYLKTLVKKSAEFGNGKIHIIVNNAGSAPIPHMWCAPLTGKQVYMGRRNSQGMNTFIRRWVHSCR
jgi:NAD(P)-dependent dehydrogenase (short-subunit alcohol dehydrogenase family)